MDKSSVPTNNGRITRFHGEPSPIAELRRRSTDRPRSLEDSAQMVGTVLVIAVAAIVMALVLL